MPKLPVFSLAYTFHISHAFLIHWNTDSTSWVGLQSSSDISTIDLKYSLDNFFFFSEMSDSSSCKLVASWQKIFELRRFSIYSAVDNI